MVEENNSERNQKILALARDLARERTDEGLNKAAEILLHLIDEGCEDPEVLIIAATYMLQGSWMSKFGAKKEAVAMVDKAISRVTDKVSLLESAVHCYELTLNEFPDRLNDILQICLRILELDPEHIESMITLADHRENPRVALPLADAIRMMEWAQEIAPGNIYVNFTLARLYHEAGQHQKARRLYQKSVVGSESNSEKPKSSNMPYRNQTRRRYGIN